MTVEHGFAAELAAKARRGTLAVFATRLVSVGTTLASITILARLIPPADFGVWALAWLALGLMSLVGEFGLAASIVQARTLSPREKDGYFWASLTFSLAAAALLALASPLIAHVYGVPQLRDVILVSCIALVVNGLGLVHGALLRRELQYSKVAFVDGGAMLCGLLTGLTTGYLWRDVWALVASQIAQCVWASSMEWTLYRWVPGRPARRILKMNLAFSFHLALYNVLAYAANNVGLAAGFRFGAAELGFFNRGRMLCHVTQFAFLTPITEVGLALLCRLKEDRAYTSAYVALARRVWVLFLPFGAVLPIVSLDLVLALLGPNWAPAAPILAWFAPSVVGQAFALLLAQLLTSQGRARELRAWAAGDVLLRAGGAIAGSAFGIVGLAAGFSLATLFLSVPLLLWIAGRAGPVTLRHQAAALSPGLLLAATAIAFAGVADLAANRLGLAPGWSRLLPIGGAAALGWGLACLALRPARLALLGKGMAGE